MPTQTDMMLRRCWTATVLGPLNIELPTAAAVNSSVLQDATVNSTILQDAAVNSAILQDATMNSTVGLSVPHRKHITSPLRVQQVNAIYWFVTMVY
jgi:hypothetical protein